jgi:hypothetical protein
VARNRTTKKIAQRIDLNYFKRPTPLKRAKFWLSVLAVLLALIWVTSRVASGDHRIYSSGHLSAAHAILEKNCAACHLRASGTSSAKALNSACISCHDGPIHHVTKNSAPDCADCHTEHHGRRHPTATRNQSCAGCHGDLRASSGTSNFSNAIVNFENVHPEFAALRSASGAMPRDPSTIKLNHALHLKPIRRSPNGPLVTLECENCHRSAAVAPDLTYSDPVYPGTAVSYKTGEETLSVNVQTLKPPRPMTGRELMVPVKFANACAGCHSLAFDKRLREGVPHDKPEVVVAFLAQKYSQYISVHPAELREVAYPDREITGKAPVTRQSALTPSQWIAERMAVAEELLWHKTCAQCHSITMTPLPDAQLGRWDAATHSAPSAQIVRGNEFALVIHGKLPTVSPANITSRWMPHAKFDHEAHRPFTCVSCHAKAATSTESSEILLPGIETCRRCHGTGAGHAESSCFECHTYHDWSRRREVTPSYNLPEMRSSVSR